MLSGPLRTAGFTLVEVIIALTIFMVGVLGLGAAGVGMVRNAMELEVRELGLQAIDGRLSTIQMDPRYGSLDSAYSGTESDVLGRFTRVTSVTRTLTSLPGGGVLDYRTVNVVVSGGGLQNPLAGSITVARP